MDEGESLSLFPIRVHSCNSWFKLFSPPFSVPSVCSVVNPPRIP